jgi:hypothetical protein
MTMMTLITSILRRLVAIGAAQQCARNRPDLNEGRPARLAAKTPFNDSRARMALLRRDYVSPVYRLERRRTRRVIAILNFTSSSPSPSDFEYPNGSLHDCEAREIGAEMIAQFFKPEQYAYRPSRRRA